MERHYQTEVGGCGGRFSDGQDQDGEGWEERGFEERDFHNRISVLKVVPEALTLYPLYPR
ncbi:hypothetical protein N7478_011999 [Penicillium angulare]|uniref:uncharacterized protein n=1 Tax=Penicillium angulare TaxID=116970 RepID=UPI0025422449|nr:uncharacterized protein N7478_011999 [Penicillium angulare]KAJ5261404.1 hypothetical protein N7478_011999 [Penicillium angulare]